MEKKTVVKKPAAKATETKKPSAPKASTHGKYVEAVGRRKTSVARVRLYPGKAQKSGSWDITVNEKPFQKFFSVEKQQRILLAPFAATEENYPVTVLVKGGGVNSQAEAVRLGISRVLVAINPAYRGKLKALDFLKRDPRMVERKKFGSRKARRPQQWRKR